MGCLGGRRLFVRSLGGQGELSVRLFGWRGLFFFFFHVTGRTTKILNNISTVIV